jgi:Lysyl-tRNA synthetase (class II)
LSVQWDQERLRLLEELRQRGVNPYPHKFNMTHTIADLRRIAAQRQDKPHEPFLADVATAGRVANIRRHGKASFVDVFDEGERLQLYLRVNELGDRYEEFLHFVGRGDIIASGRPVLHHEGELSLLVKDYQLLSKPS